MNLNLENKSALVCGSTQGIGKAAAEELALLGANVTLIARNSEKLKVALLDLDTSKGQAHSFLVADFTKPEEVKSVVTNHINAGNPFHILINNTGGPPGGQAIDADVSEFLSAFNNHLICNQILAQAVTPSMEKAGYGRIINVISTSVKIPLKGLGVSNTIRGAVANWSKTLANELGVKNITVNNVLPGATNTVRLKSIIENKATKTNQEFNEVMNGMAAQVPMGRIGEAHEVGAAIAFLASPAASYINGVNLPVDGGRTGSL